MLLLVLNMGNDKTDVLQGTLALMILKTLDTLGPQHGYGLARRIEQMSEGLLRLNQGTLYPALVRLEPPEREAAARLLRLDPGLRDGATQLTG